jgi:hypothetical protein
MEMNVEYQFGHGLAKTLSAALGSRGSLSCRSQEAREHRLNTVTVYPCGLEQVTIRHEIASKSDSGPKRIDSLMLGDTKLPSVIMIIKIVITQETILIEIEGGPRRQSPALRRIAMADSPSMTAATTLAILKGDVRTVWVPPHAIVTGKMPAANKSCSRIAAAKPIVAMLPAKRADEAPNNC